MVAMLDPPLQSDLLTIKYSHNPADLYPNHAYGKGGVGHLLATGARAGINRLPQTVKSCINSARSQGSQDTTITQHALNATGIASVNAALAAQVAVVTAKEWEKGTIRHPHDFYKSTRSARPRDVPHASKWAGISFYESDPSQVSHHLAVTEYLEQSHVQGKLIERELERHRHSEWSAAQRETFRRQRLEQAARYARSGMRPRSAYADLGATAAASELQETLNATIDSHQPGTPPVSALQASFAIPAFNRPLALGLENRSMSAPHAATSPLLATLYSNSISQVNLNRTSASASSTTSGHALVPSTSASFVQAGSSPKRGRPHTASGGHYTSGSMTQRSQQFQRSLTTGSSGATASSRRPVTAIPLPKPTYTRVYARMAAENAEHPALKAQAHAAEQAAEARRKELAHLDEEIQGLDMFEAQMRHLQRARSRANAGRRITDDNN